MLKHVSYSSLKDWVTCPYYFKLVQVDKIDGFEGNIHTAFGNALHDTCEAKVVNHKLDEQRHFDLSFLVAVEKLPEDIKSELKVEDLKAMRKQGKELAPLVLPSLKGQFGDYEVVSAEEKLYEPITEFEEHDYMFKGFIDLVIKTSDGKYHVIDYKTTSWGWGRDKRTDPMVNYQLVLYKYYWSKKHNIDLKDIETHFVLLKRTAKKDKVEFLRVTSAKKRIENSLNMLKKALYNINKNRWIKNRTSCSRCKFYRTEHCT